MKVNYIGQPLEAAQTASHRMWVSVNVYRNGRQIEMDLPFTDGEISQDSEQNIPGELTLTVPAGEANKWVPVNPLDPLAPFGQWMQVLTGVQFQGGGFDPWYSILNSQGTNQGRYIIWSTDPDPLSGELKVTAYSLEKMLEETRLVRTYGPMVGSTLLDEAYRFVQGRMPFRYSLPAGVTNRATPSKLVFEGSRLDILDAIGAAWPARFRVDGFGTMRVRAPVDKLDRTPALRLSTGADGVIAKWGAPNSRDELYNGVFARGEDQDAAGRVVLGIATDNNPNSPTYWNGPFGQRPLEYTSPLLTTPKQALVAARAMLARRLRRARVVEVEMVPNHLLELDDYVDLDTPQIKGVGRVASYKLPLTPGVMTLTLDDFIEAT